MTNGSSGPTTTISILFFTTNSLIAQSPKIEKLYIAPGNAGTSNVGENVAIKADDFTAIREFVVKNNIDMVVVGPEDPLVKGILTISKKMKR